MSDTDILDEDVPNEYLCPITLEIMREPMVFPDGHTYEKEAIKRALDATHVSPLTKIPMNFSDGVINYSLKSLIEAYVKSKSIQLEDIDFDDKIKKFIINNDEKIENIEFEELYGRYISKEQSNNLCKDSIHVCMKPKKIENTPPLCLICVVDISGSMGNNCCNNIDGMESMYLSRLELIKHSIKTIVSTLRDNDMISIITFNDRAQVITVPVLLKSKEERKKVIDSMDQITPGRATNMWDGIKVALDLSKSIPYENCSKSIMVFTDGDSNINPPTGVYDTLKNAIQSSNDKFTISTFSFGNDIGPKLLVDIANLCNGVYGYCPDGSMVGTIFINYMSNLLSTITPIVKVTVTQGESVKKTMTIGPLYRGAYRNAIFKINKKLLDQTKVIVELPMTQQKFEVPINFDSPNLESYINEMSELEKKEKEKKMEIDDTDNDGNGDGDDDDDDELLDEESDDDTIVVENIDTNALIKEKDLESIKYEEILLNQLIRNKFIITLHKISKMYTIKDDPEESEKAKKILKEYFDLLNGLKYKTKFIKSLLIDIDNPDPSHGQVEKAIHQEYFKIWGECYINSFLRFHQYEQCGNFKDQSLQYYSFDIFSTYRKMAHAIFTHLPPPKMTKMSNNNYGTTFNTNSNNNNSYNNNNNNNNNNNYRNNYRNNSRFTANHSTSTCMSSFLNRHGGCFNGEAIVLLANGETKYVKDLKKGDRLNNNAIVQCLIEQTSSSKKLYMCNIQGVLLTPYHPILMNNIWYFPVDLVEAKEISINSWFNLILMDEENRKYEVEFSNGIKAITLGHYREENEILKHPYFGTDLVLKDLKERDPLGYSNGYIFINEFNPRQLQFDENNQYCINYYKKTFENENTNLNINSNNNPNNNPNNQIQELIY
ncbi:hypothetical protein BCR32DRAFT_324292 [Anaeromyces robustus]|uniref:VWFA domain-containing protein n=1 Tax=Anaeromyces robustus TaxID=1754192 RepID=A0A1Y1XPU8_9FUNG|nr:hypothetical protein BCR32DRAFT_324292 [Anaeromyces robustus]|eukprot:ORX87767.1 hypothetical protein BCR32DRAFT_324292 [Anaeromyces robustus]